MKSSTKRKAVWFSSHNVNQYFCISVRNEKESASVLSFEKSCNPINLHFNLLVHLRILPPHILHTHAAHNIATTVLHVCSSRIWAKHMGNLYNVPLSWYGTGQLQGNICTRPRHVLNAFQMHPAHVPDVSCMRPSRVLAKDASVPHLVKKAWKLRRFCCSFIARFCLCANVSRVVLWTWS